MTDTAIEQRDADLPEEEAVVTALLAGRTVNSVRKQFNLTIDDIDRIIARAWPVDQRARVRMIMTDLGKLDRLIDEMVQRSFAAEGQVSAAFANAAIKGLERKHDLCGMSAASRIELQVIRPPSEQTSYEKITQVLLGLKHDHRPNGDGAAPVSSADGPDRESTGTDREPPRRPDLP